MYYIYEIRNIKTNKRYIGRTKELEKRKARHFRELRQGKHHCIYLQRSYNKYGEENFIFNKIDERESFEDICKLEEEYINNPNEELYNVSKNSTGGDNISHNPNREEIIKKMSIASKKKWEDRTPEERERFSNNLKGEKNPNYKNRGENSPLYGIPFTEEHKRKISEAQKNKPLTEKQKANLQHLREINLGREPWNKGKKLKPLSQECKEKISKALKGKPSTNVRKVCCEGILFKSLKQAGDYYGISSNGIIIRIKSKTDRFKDFFYFDENTMKEEDFIKYEEIKNKLK